MPDDDEYPETAIELLEQFRTRINCFKMLTVFKTTEADKFICSHCGSSNTKLIGTRPIWACKDCRTQSSIKTGTFMQDSPVDICKWCAVVFYIANEATGVMNYETFRALDVTQKTAWRMMHRIRMTMNTPTFRDNMGELKTEEFYGGYVSRSWLANNKTFKHPDYPFERYMDLLSDLMQIHHCEILEQERIYEMNRHLRQPKRKRTKTPEQREAGNFISLCRNSKDIVLERHPETGTYIPRAITAEERNACEEQFEKCLHCKFTCSRQLAEL